MRELRREIPRTRVRRTPEAARAGVSRGRIPTPDPPTEPGEGPEPRRTGSRAGVPRRGGRTRPAGRIGGRRRRGGGLPLETRGAVRPDAGTAEAAARADGSPPGTRALADPGARIIRQAHGRPGAGGTQAADRGVAPGEGGHPETRRGPHGHGEDVPEHPPDAKGRIAGPGDVAARPDLRVPPRARVPREGVRSSQGTGVGHPAAGRRVPGGDEPRAGARAGDREARGAPAGQSASPRRTPPRSERGGVGHPAATVGTRTEGVRGTRRLEERADDRHDPVESGARRNEEPPRPARRANGAVDGGTERPHAAAKGAARVEGRTEGRDERRRRAARRPASGQDQEVCEVREVRPVRRDPRPTPAVMPHGVARESPEISAARRDGRRRRTARADAPRTGGRRARSRGEGPRGAASEGTGGCPQTFGSKGRGDRPPGERAHATRTEFLDGSRQARCRDSRDPGSESRGGGSPRETGRARSGNRGEPQEAPGRSAHPDLQGGERARRGEERSREDANEPRCRKGRGHLGPQGIPREGNRPHDGDDEGARRRSPNGKRSRANSAWPRPRKRRTNSGPESSERRGSSSRSATARLGTKQRKSNASKRLCGPRTRRSVAAKLNSRARWRGRRRKPRRKSRRRMHFKSSSGLRARHPRERRTWLPANRGSTR